MRTLSIRQPWAWLITHGHKPVENRDWSTDWRGELLIHAGKVFDEAGLDSVLEAFPELRHVLPQSYELGGIVGAAMLSACVTQSASPWFTGPHGFMLERARPLDFRPWRGQLGFFDVPLDDALRTELGRPSLAEAEAAGQGRMFT
ncbi:MAG TPA: ASCH domain-containing protein [Methylibium sp.]|nr:ASCH domain-containing protein [Methylibium sp.]